MDKLEKVFPNLLASSQAPFFYGGSAWATFEDIEIYIRINPRYVLDDIKVCVVIANIIGTKKGRGVFTRAIKYIQTQTDWTIYLEQVRQDFAETLINKYHWQRNSKYDLFLINKT